MKPAAPLPALLVTAIFITLSYSHADATDYPFCQSESADSDNDGWGWENHRPCLVENSMASTALEERQSRLANVVAGNLGNFPLCTTPDADADGDGWGHEFNRSCRVTVATQTNELPAATESQSTTVATTATSEPASDIQNGLYRGKFPICASAQTDADNDGWGYENYQSCYVAPDTPEVSTQAPVTDTPALATTTDTTAPESEIVDGLYEGRFQVCSSASSDIDNDGWGYEFRRSCKVVQGYVDPQQALTTTPVGNAVADSVGQIYNQDFSTSEVGLYLRDQLNADWETPLWQLGFDQGWVSIVDTGGDHGNAMQVIYPAGRYGAGGASAFLSDIQFGMGLPETFEELYVAYDIRFGDNFDFVKGGKLPGLCGAANDASPETGCNTGGGYPTGYDGWSARGMWREDGDLENYIYHAGQRNYYGDDELWGVRAIPGVWHRVENRVVLNTPGQKNGILEAWFDGTKVLSLHNIEYRKKHSIGINLFYFSTFFGGNDASWAPATDQKMNFDNFVLSTDKID